MKYHITGISISEPELETLVILGLVWLTIVCCFAFWLCVIKPVRQHFEHEYVIADFRREMSDWEHDPCR